MLNQAFDTANDHSWVPSSAWQGLRLLEHQSYQSRKADFLDHLPVMSATVLGLEMLLQEPCIDLRIASELILSDVGATIQILRLIGREYDLAAERPSRMGDCLSSLDVDSWFGAISAHTFPCDRKHAATTAVWRHCRLVAQYAQLVAESLDTVSPEDAYLVGLLHGIAEIPAALGWPNCGRGGTDANALAAMEGTLPLFVLSALRSINDSSSSSGWRCILTAAHELAGAGIDMAPPGQRNSSVLGVNKS
ncbi:MAG: HDOD domain-containing protein [Terracidiphilus sp.]